MLRDRNFYVVFGILWLVFILAIFFTALLDSTAGEVAGAVGSVIGGSVGALGAAAAVYLTLKLQRDDETIKVTRAVIMEIATLSKFPSGQLDTCIMIHSGQFDEARRNTFMTMMGTPIPVIYPSVAGQISRHPQVELIVGFYTGLQETHATAEVIAAATQHGPTIRREDVIGLGVLLREQCRLARDILRADGSLPGSSPLSDQMIEALSAMLERSVTTADRTFPSLAEYQAATAPH